MEEDRKGYAFELKCQKTKNSIEVQLYNKIQLNLKNGNFLAFKRNVKSY